MNIENEKCVVIVDEKLPLGIIANTAVILGITLGVKMPDVVGKDVSDKNGNVHSGIIQFPVPVLRGSDEVISNLRNRIFDDEFSDLTVVDFTELAQHCKTYDEYVSEMAECANNELKFIGLAVCGDKKKVNKLTGNMPLLR